MSNCLTCGQNYLKCTCESQQPFCDQCNESNKCNLEMDAYCVIYHPDDDSPTQLININKPNGSNLEDILEAIDSFLGNNANIPITPVDTSTIDLIVSGRAEHTLTANLIISPDINNQLEVRSNGLFAKPYNENYLVKVNASDSPNYLENQIVGGTDGVVSITTDTVDGQVKVQPSIDIECLLNEIKDNANLMLLFCQIKEMCNCFIMVTNLDLVYAPACPLGYTLIGSDCVQIDEVAPTIGGSTITACATQYYEYSQYGAIVYNAGFTATGTGIGSGVVSDASLGNVTLINTSEVWRDDINNIGTNDPNYGPANRTALWNCVDPAFEGTLGFVVPVNAPFTKTYFVAIAADNEFSLSIDGLNIVVTTNAGGNAYWASDGGAKFRYWHIYPVNLTAGVHYIGISGINTGGPGFIAAEIYDNTLAELQAAALDPLFTSDRAGFPLDQNVYSNLNLLFTTRCARTGGTFSIGNATCPVGYNLDTTGGDPLVPPCQGINASTLDWVCTRTLTTPFTGYTATLVWDRIPEAVNYQIQQKLTSDPDSAYINSVGSPVANPTTGTTVSLIISGLASNQMTFRIRANYGPCFSEWTVIES
jgi:hypothetical protein